MRRIHKLFAVGASGLLLALVLTPTALATGTNRAGLGGAASRAAGVPNSNIKGSPAHWSPTSLSATARNPKGVTTCSSSHVSFTMTNKTSKPKFVKVTGTGGINSISGTIAPHATAGVCVTKGYTGTEHATLKDGKKLTIKF